MRKVQGRGRGGNSQAEGGGKGPGGAFQEPAGSAAGGREQDERGQPGRSLQAVRAARGVWTPLGVQWSQWRLYVETQ